MEKRALKPEMLRAFRRAVEATGIGPLVAHDSYLINLATTDPALLQKSRDAFLEEMKRAEALGLDFVVTHMGAHTGAGEECGLRQLCDSLNWLHQQLPNARVRVALETTAGQGTCLGGSFDHFPLIFAQVDEPNGCPSVWTPATPLWPATICAPPKPCAQRWTSSTPRSAFIACAASTPTTR
jgi:deoxyribonuclease-4